MIKFTTWEEWNDMVEKIKAGLVVCPDCSQWVDGLQEIPEEYRNLEHRRNRIWWESRPNVSVEEKEDAIQEYWRHFAEKTKYCCETCIARRAHKKEIIDLEEKYDKCHSCGEWVEKGLVRPHRRHKRAMTQLFCPRCIEIDRVETEFLVLTAKERQRIFAHNKRTRQLGLVSDLTIREWLEIIERYRDRCAYCGEPWTDLEHIIPVAKGGGTTKTNVVPACRMCNTEKRSKELELRQH